MKPSLPQLYVFAGRNSGVVLQILILRLLDDGMHPINFHSMLLLLGAVQHNVIHQIAEIVVFFLRFLTRGRFSFASFFQVAGRSHRFTR